MKKTKKGLPGFTLIELSIVMIIVGIITGAVFKAQDLMESARLRSTWDQINQLKFALISYKDQYGYWPGNDPRADRFGEGANAGTGTGLIAQNEQDHVWGHLVKAGLGGQSGEEAVAPSAKIGGNLFVQSYTLDGSTANFIVLAQNSEKKGILTPKQALALKHKAGEKNMNSGVVRLADGEGEAGGACIKEGILNLKTTTPACIALISLQ